MTVLLLAMEHHKGNYCWLVHHDFSMICYSAIKQTILYKEAMFLYLLLVISLFISSFCFSVENPLFNACSPSQFPSFIDTEALFWRTCLIHTQAQMEPTNITQEIKTTLTNLIADREQLQTTLRYAQSTISELETQNRELERLLSNAQALLPSRKEVRGYKIPPNTSVIGGTWLSCHKVKSILTPVELAWQRGKPQQALVLLTLILKKQNITENQRADAELLFSVILRSASEWGQALIHAEICLSIAIKAQLYDLVCKAQFHRGLCYLYEDQYANAHWCFVLASHTPGYEGLAEINKLMAEQKLLELPSDDPRRDIKLCFL